MEILSLIPSHLPCDADVVRASSVCRLWRRALTRHAALWSKLDLGVARSYDFVETRLERTKGSALDITTSFLGCPAILALLGSRGQQFRNLHFLDDCWSYIQKFSEAASGPLPLLRRLKIYVADSDLHNVDPTIGPSVPLFTGAVNLEEFSLRVEGGPHLNHFAFPHLSTLELFAVPQPASNSRFPASQLLDFLEATPTLQTVCVRIVTEISLEGILPGRMVTLPKVKKFSVSESPWEPSYKIATYISCPSAKHISLMKEGVHNLFLPDHKFPTWNMIPPQHIPSQVNEIALELNQLPFFDLSCSLSLLSPGPETLKLDYRMTGIIEDGVMAPLEGDSVEVASHTIQDRPLLEDVKRLHIQDRHRFVSSDHLGRVTKVVRRLLKSMGSLEELTLDISDLRPYLAPFFNTPDFNDLEKSHTYPQIKCFTISNRRSALEMDSRIAIAQFVESQHALGIPIERIVLRTVGPAEDLAEMVQPWVGVVHCHQEMAVPDIWDSL